MLITILAEDIRTSNYYDGIDCAISRALERVGITNLVDCGDGIHNLLSNSVVIPDTLPSYQVLRTKVMGMYKTAGKLKDTPSQEGLASIPPITPLPIEDCSFELPI